MNDKCTAAIFSAVKMQEMLVLFLAHWTSRILSKYKHWLVFLACYRCLDITIVLYFKLSSFKYNYFMLKALKGLVFCCSHKCVSSDCRWMVNMGNANSMKFHQSTVWSCWGRVLSGHAHCSAFICYTSDISFCVCPPPHQRCCCGWGHSECWHVAS